MHPTVWLPWENKIREMRMSPRKTNSGCNFFLCRGMHLILSRTTNHYVRRTAISCASSNIFPVSIQHYGDINCTIIFIPVYRLLFLYDDAFATPILRAQYALCYIKHKLILFTWNNGWVCRCDIFACIYSYIYSSSRFIESSACAFT